MQIPTLSIQCLFKVCNHLILSIMVPLYDNIMHTGMDEYVASDGDEEEEEE